MRASEKIHQAVISLPGVTAHPHRFGGTEYRLGKRELGHVHGDHLVDIPFPKKVRDEVIAAELAEPHHVLPESGWVSVFLRQPSDVEAALALLRRSYELAVEQKTRKSSNPSEFSLEKED
jgi:hypothetical protein